MKDMNVNVELIHTYERSKTAATTPLPIERAANTDLESEYISSELSKVINDNDEER